MLPGRNDLARWAVFVWWLGILVPTVFGVFLEWIGVRGRGPSITVWLGFDVATLTISVCALRNARRHKLERQTAVYVLVLSAIAGAVAVVFLAVYHW